MDCAFPASDRDNGFIQKPDTELGPQSIQDGTNQQRTEQALCHCTQRVNAVPLEIIDKVFLLEKLFDFVHVIHISFIIDILKKETGVFSLRSSG